MFRFSFVNLHALTEDKQQEENYLFFYKNVITTLNIVPRRRIQIVLGDLNGNFEKDITFRSVTGKHSLHDTGNVNRLKLIDLATERSLQ